MQILGILSNDTFTEKTPYVASYALRNLCLEDVQKNIEITY